MHTPSLKGTAPWIQVGLGLLPPPAPPFSLLKKPPLEGSALNTQVVIPSSHVSAQNVCTNKPFHAQLHSVIYSVALANNKSPNRSPPPNSIRKHGSWNTGTVHEVYGVKLIANMALPHYLEGETLMPSHNHKSQLGRRLTSQDVACQNIGFLSPFLVVCLTQLICTWIFICCVP